MMDFLYIAVIVCVVAGVPGADLPLDVIDSISGI